MIGTFLVVFIIVGVLYGLANLVSMGDAHRWILRERPDSLRLTAKAKLSWPSRQIVKEFYALPKDWRPRGVDILAIAQALDIKYGRKVLDNHFCEWVYNRYKWTTYGGKDRAHCDHAGGTRWGSSCPGAEHVALHNEFSRLGKALAEQEAQIRLTSIAGDLDALEAMKQSMAESRKIINDTTKELS